MKAYYAHFIILAVILSACKPDDQTPCEGENLDVIYQRRLEDSGYFIMDNIDTITYKRTPLTTSTMSDTLKLVKVGVDSTYENFAIDESGECPRVYWKTHYTYTYTDKSKDVTIQQTVAFFRQWMPATRTEPLQIEVGMNDDGINIGGFYVYSEDENGDNTIKRNGQREVNGKIYYDVVVLFNGGIVWFVYSDEYGIVKKATRDYLYELIPN